MEYDKNNIFAKILKGEIPCKKIYENDYVLSFHDVNPQKKVHVLVIPKGEYIDLDDFNSKASDNEIKSVFELIQKREECRKNKQFDEADAIRGEMLGMGIQLIDHTTKTLWIKKEKIKADI